MRAGIAYIVSMIFVPFFGATFVVAAAITLAVWLGWIDASELSYTLGFGSAEPYVEQQWELWIASLRDFYDEWKELAAVLLILLAVILGGYAGFAYGKPVRTH